jgi:hypothetical protein
MGSARQGPTEGGRELIEPGEKRNKAISDKEHGQKLQALSDAMFSCNALEAICTITWKPQITPDAGKRERRASCETLRP